MKQRWMLALVAVAMIALWSSSAIAQNFAKVYGVCKDAEGSRWWAQRYGMSTKTPAKIGN